MKNRFLSVFRTINTAASEKTDAASKFFKDTIRSASSQMVPSPSAPPSAQPSVKSQPQNVEDTKNEVGAVIVPSSPNEPQKPAEANVAASPLNLPGLVFDKVSQFVESVPGSVSTSSVQTVTPVEALAFNGVHLMTAKEFLNFYNTKVLRKHCSS